MRCLALKFSCKCSLPCAWLHRTLQVVIAVLSICAAITRSAYVDERLLTVRHTCAAPTSSEYRPLSRDEQQSSGRVRLQCAMERHTNAEGDASATAAPVDGVPHCTTSSSTSASGADRAGNVGSSSWSALLEALLISLCDDTPVWLVTVQARRWGACARIVWRSVHV